MELFKYRNLALGCCAFLIALFLSFYTTTLIRITTLCFSGVVLILLFIIYLTKRNSKSLNMVCHYSPALLFIMLAMVISLASFDKSELEKLCDEKEHSINATITQVNFQSNHFGAYTAELYEIDGEPFKDRIKATLYSSNLQRGDTISAKGYFSKIRHSDIGFDEADYLLSGGITIAFEGYDIEITGYVKFPVKDFLDGANSFLDTQLSKINDEDTHSMLSALFLGNKSLLSDSIKRDFTRIGLSHVLALSGMHITIIITLFGFAITPLPLPRTIKELLLILSTFIFVGITGFSESALRAGIMVCLVYFLFFFGSRANLISALFYSVTLICIFSPYSIFSLSLLLSFFAMLGCIISSKFIHRVGFLRNSKIKLFKFIIYTFISSAFASVFTLPLISIFFGSFTVLSLITNIVVSPLFSLLIYLSPVFLMASSVPYASTAIGFICIKVTRLATFLGEQFSKIENLIIPIINTAQLIGVLVISIFLLGVLICAKKHLKCMVLGCICGILIFIGGTVFLFVQRYNNVYVGGYSFLENDIVFIEDENEITVFDITNTKKSDYAYANGISAMLGYSEIDNYVITDYSTTTHICFDNLSSNIIVKRVFVPLPMTDEELSVYSQICEIGKQKSITVEFFKTEFKTQNTRVTFAKSTNLPRTSKRVIAFTIESGTSKFTYLGAGAFELCDSFVDESVYLSDIVIFGAYGAKYKIEFDYDVPYLDYCVFFGSSEEYASDSFYEKINDKRVNINRFCIGTN
ncbi:MAG: ComEC/Rec2 family competence protein [Clostridia bacterium]|nr:ComEC/Rec2 family competence protein [Clostridia bacterium]